MFIFRAFFAAVGFMTPVPIPSKWRGRSRELGASKWFFPWVGVCIGIAAAYFDLAVGWAFHGTMLRDVFTLIFMVAVSKALHLDGLADTADGFLSSRPREMILEIMRDSRSGVMGVMAIVSVLLLKLAALSALPQSLRFQAIFLVPVLGRASILVQLATLPYARKEGGLATAFMNGPAVVLFLYGASFMAGTGFYLGQLAGLLGGAGVLILTLLFALYSRLKIGGLTGDTLGAGVEIAEVGALIFFVAFKERIPCF